MKKNIDNDIRKVMRKKRKSGRDPNDRGYSHKLNKQLRRMKQYEDKM